MRLPAALFGIALLVTGCGGYSSPETPTPTPTPSPSLPPGVVLGPSSGPAAITFVSSEPAPGATLAGCGASSTGCAGRIALHFRLRPTQSGHVLRFVASLHDASLAACLLAASGPFDLTAGVEAPLDIVLDQPGTCATPTDTTTLAATLEGTTSVASRQEWGVRYSLRP